jgi:predicted Zn-dependent protease
MMSVPAQALNIIRDTQIEKTLEVWSAPILKEAGLSNDQVRLVLVNSDQVNAFVAGGANIFIYAGLIEKAEYPEEIKGVIAHEIGHITGGHLIAGRKAIERASFQSILATALGIGAAILTGDGRAAAAISAGGSGAATAGFLSHSRIQESAADQAGFQYMEDAGVNPQGIVSFLEKLEGQELLPASQQSEYMRTHPLTRDRVDTMRVKAQKSGVSGPLGVSQSQKDFDLMKAKLMAFRKPNMVPRYYDLKTNADDALYAHAIMRYRQSRYDQAVNLFDQLIEKSPDNPFFHEMKAQTLRDAGRLADSEIAYRKALSHINNAPLIQGNLAHVMITQQKTNKEIGDLLSAAIQADSRDTNAYRLMATYKGRIGLEADAQYYLAEEAAAQKRHIDAKRLVNLAINSENLSQNLKIKASDLKTYLDRLPIKGNSE